MAKFLLRCVLHFNITMLHLLRVHKRNLQLLKTFSRGADIDAIQNVCSTSALAAKFFRLYISPVADKIRSYEVYVGTLLMIRALCNTHRCALLQI